MQLFTSSLRRKSERDSGCLLSVVMGMLISLSCVILPARAEAFAFQERIENTKSLAHYAMGQVYDLLGMTSEAVLEYEQAAQFDPGSYMIRLRLGANYARLDMLNEAIEELKLVSRYNPDDLQSHYLLALIYSTQRQYDKAAGEYELILKSFSAAEPKNIEIYGYLGQLYYSQKKYQQAIEQFERILEIEPENADILYLLGSLYFEINDGTRSVELLKRSIDVDPLHDGSLNTLGYIYAEEEINLQEALDLVSRALEVSPNNGAYLDSLGWVYFKMGEYKVALDKLNQAREHLKDPVIYEHLGDVYFAINNLDKAIEYWEMSLQLSPNQDVIEKKINEVKSSQAKSN